MPVTPGRAVVPPDRYATVAGWKAVHKAVVGECPVWVDQRHMAALSRPRFYLPRAMPLDPLPQVSVVTSSQGRPSYPVIQLMAWCRS
jgi:hypothetical protein